MENVQHIKRHITCCLNVGVDYSLIDYDDLVMIILEFEGCYHQVYELEKRIIYLNNLLADTEIQWQRRNIIGTIERIEKKYVPPGTPSSSSSDDAFFSNNIENTQIQDPGTPSSQSSSQL